MYPQSEHDKHLGMPSYTFDTGLKVKDTIPPIPEQTRNICYLHGRGCLGHIERNGNEIFMPSNMTRSSVNNEHALMLAKSKRLHGKMTKCKTALWNNNNDSSYVEEDYNAIVPSISPLIVNKSNTMACTISSGSSFVIPQYF